MNSILNRIGIGLQKYLFPWPCLLCGSYEGATYGLCEDCRYLLPVSHHQCQICGLPIPLKVETLAICGQCMQEPPCFDRLYSPFWYQPPISTFITQFKYHAQGEMAATLAHCFLASSIPKVDDCLFIPVPSHKQRIRERGFNAVYELLKLINDGLAYDLDTHVVARTRYTAPQKGKSKSERKRNIRGAFKLLKPIEYKHVIIFDEVVTTGATVNELSRVLKKSGVTRVDVWAIARTTK